jgi:hypothetical protein
MNRPHLNLEEIARDFEKKLREAEGSECHLLPLRG